MGKKFINFIISDQSVPTGKKRGEGIEGQLKGAIATNYWQPMSIYSSRKACSIPS
jgi:hypothetical protein